MEENDREGLGEAEKDYGARMVHLPRSRHRSLASR